MQATRLPFFCAGAFGQAVRHVVAEVGGDALEAADGDGLLVDARPRRHAGSHGRSHVRPRMPGKTFDSRLSMYASV